MKWTGENYSELLILRDNSRTGWSYLAKEDILSRVRMAGIPTQSYERRMFSNRFLPTLSLKVTVHYSSHGVWSGPDAADDGGWMS